MQFRDLKAQYLYLKNDIDSAISQVLNSSSFISGKQVAELETTLADYVGVKHCITCGNGTDALSMILMAWNIKAGDAVFVPDFTFFASAEVVAFEGATPVFYDVCADTYNADASSLEAAIQAVLKEGRLVPRAIIAVDLFGLPANYDAIKKVAAKYHLLLLEDGAQGFGGSIRDQRACSFADAAATSFFPAKPLGCYGDGGAIFTDNDDVADYVRSIRVHGKGAFKYDNVRIGWNSRLDTIQAAVLQVKFKAFLANELDDVNSAAEKYTKLLKGMAELPVIPTGMRSSWAQYTIRLKSEEQRDGLQSFLKEHGIPSMVYYPKPMHGQKAFEGNQEYVKCTTAELLCRTVLSLPIHPYITDEEIISVVQSVGEYLGRNII